MQGQGLLGGSGQRKEDSKCLPTYKGTWGRMHNGGFINCFLCGMQLKLFPWDFPGGAVVKNLPANAGDTGSSPGLGRSHMPWSN